MEALVVRDRSFGELVWQYCIGGRLELGGEVLARPNINGCKALVLK